MPTFLTPIVGTHFHPPAKLLLTKLPVGTPLILFNTRQPLRLQRHRDFVGFLQQNSLDRV